MKIHSRNNSTTFKQYWIGILSVVFTSCACFLSAGFIGYKVVALIFLVNISILAMLFDILPVLVSAILSSLIWNFFFIPPILTFHISNADDLMMFLLYFIIASVHAVLTFKIRKQEAIAREKEERDKTIKLYDTLLNSLSHELRTPIAAIIGSIDVLNENEASITPENRKELLEQISIAGMKLNTHVENLLGMNRIESGTLRLNCDWCDVNELMFKAIESIATPYSQKLIFEAKENLPYFKMDAVLIEQAIVNIISNSIAYSKANEVILISVCQEGNACKISIADCGAGFVETDIKRLFEKFFRGQNVKTGGLGIGLSIVKGFCEAHGGEILVEENVSKGLTFTLSIPAEISYLNHLKNE